MHPLPPCPLSPPARAPSALLLALASLVSARPAGATDPLNSNDKPVNGDAQKGDEPGPAAGEFNLLPIFGGSTDIGLGGGYFAGYTLGGALDVPSPALTVALSGAVAELSLHDTDLSAGLTLLRLRAVLGEARVRDARAITQLVSAKLPVLAPLVLGNGPLVASLSAEVTPLDKTVRLLTAALGGARLHGAAHAGPGGWSGAAAGHFSKVSFGLRLREGVLDTSALVGAGWLARELAAAGLATD